MPLPVSRALLRLRLKKTLPVAKSRTKRTEKPRVDYRIFELRDRFVFDGAAVIGRISDMPVPDWEFLKPVMQQTAEIFWRESSATGSALPHCTVTSGFAIAGRVVEITADFEIKYYFGAPRLEMKNPEKVERAAKYLNAILN